MGKSERLKGSITEQGKAAGRICQKGEKRKKKKGSIAALVGRQNALGSSKAVTKNEERGGGDGLEGKKKKTRGRGGQYGALGATPRNSLGERGWSVNQNARRRASVLPPPPPPPRRSGALDGK